MIIIRLMLCCAKHYAMSGPLPLTLQFGDIIWSQSLSASYQAVKSWYQVPARTPARLSSEQDSTVKF